MHQRAAPVVLGLLACCLTEVQAAPPDAQSPDRPFLTTEAGGMPPPGMPFGPGPRMMGPMMGPHGEHGPVADAIHSALELEHLYREQGRGKEVPALYEDMLARTHNPALRHFAYESLARAQAQPADPDKAIGVLRRSLDESLKLADESPPPAPKP
ncbi:MAG: hypothetical protein P4L83_06365 [Nevskia sp.]|nr:hypothetical protein [Nevskia sp.]